MLYRAAKKKKKKGYFNILLRADWWKGGEHEKCAEWKMMGSETIKTRKVAVTFNYERRSCEARMKPNTIT